MPWAVLAPTAGAAAGPPTERQPGPRSSKAGPRIQEVDPHQGSITCTLGVIVQNWGSTFWIFRLGYDYEFQSLYIYIVHLQGLGFRDPISPMWQWYPYSPIAAAVTKPGMTPTYVG